MVDKLFINNENDSKEISLFKSIINSSLEAVVIVMEDGTFVDFNNSFIDLTGFSYSELNQMNYHDLTPYEWQDISHNIKDNILFKEGITDIYEKEISTKSNGHKWVKGKAIKLDYKIENKSLYCIFLQDISNEKNYQYKLELDKDILGEFYLDVKHKNEKIIESERLKTAILQNISHEVRTPLIGILGFAQILKEVNLDVETRIEYADDLLNSAKRLQSLILNILDVSKIYSSKTEVFTGEIDIDVFLSSLVDEFFMVAHKKGLKIQYDLPDDTESLIFHSDESKLHKILYNLIQNAIIFTTQGTINIGYSIENANIEFYVKDTGIGIPERFFNKIFDNFFQVETSLSRTHEGAGLGLTIVKGLVEILNGEVHLESNVGLGSRFSFTIPYHQITPNKSLIINFMNNNLQATNSILVIDDDMINLKFFNIILSDTKTLLLFANNINESIEIVKKKDNILFVILNLDLIKDSSFELISEIKLIKPNLKIVVISSNYNTWENKLALEAGADEYFANPISIEQLQSLKNKYQ